MSRRDLEDLLERIDDTREIVLGPGVAEEDHDDHHAAWVDAHRGARSAYDHWRANPGAEAYAVYRAAADRADAAVDALGRAEQRFI